jgi:hypothetical protein
VKTDLILLLAVLAFVQAQTAPRVTPLGTQQPKPANRPEKKPEPDNKEKPAVVVERAIDAHGGRQALNSIHDSVAEGTLTFFSGKSSTNTIDVTVIRKGTSRLQRVLKRGDGEVRQGSDGTSTWESFDGMTALAPAGLAGNYIESQTVRTVDILFDTQSRGLEIRDAGGKANARVLEVDPPGQGRQSSPTRYSIDEATSRVTRIEFITGEAKDILGRTVPTTESYVFSDFRIVQGVPTPFRIERYIDGLKIEETQFTSVRYNTSVKDEVFKP